MARVRVVVIGAGISGLTSALLLQANGCSVTVCDRLRVPGGRLLETNADGTRVDAGETTIAMRWVWDEFFQAIGEKTETHLQLTRVLQLARHIWSDGSTLDLDADMHASTLAIERFAGSREARAYRAFARHAAEVYRTAEASWLRAPAATGKALLLRGLKEGWGPFTRIGAHRSLTRTVASFFEDPRLRQLFGHYATNVGLTPDVASGTLALLSHLDRDATYRTTTDMKTFAWGLERVATRLGIKFLYGEPATQISIENGAVEGVATSARYIEARAVVFAGELASLHSGELGRTAAAATPKGRRAASFADRTLSAIVSAGTARIHGARLPWRTIFFSQDAQDEWKSLSHGRMPHSSTLTLALQDRAQERASDGASERVVLHALAPAVGASLGGDELANLEWEERTRERLLQHGLTLSWKSRETRTPRSYAQTFPGSEGALFGLYERGPLHALRLPAARTSVRGLALAARGVHPGSALSFACLRGRRAAEELLATMPR